MPQTRKSWKVTGIQTHCQRVPVSFNDFSDRGVLLLLPWSHSEQWFVPCERGALSQSQTIIQGVTTLTGEEHLREVM